MSDNEGTSPSAETESTETEHVEIEKADDEDLDSYLERFKAGEFDEEADEEAKPRTEGDSTQAEEAAPVEQKAPEQDDRVTLSRAELEAYQQQIARQEAENRQKEQFIQRQKQQLGEARQETKRYKAQLEGRLEDASSQAEAFQILREMEKADGVIQEIDSREAGIDKVQQTYQAVSQAVDLRSIPIDDVKEVLRADGLNENQINTFLQNPWEADAAALVQLFKRSGEKTEKKKYERALQDLIPLTERLFEELKKQKAKPERLLSEVSKAMKNGPTLNASSGNSSPKRGISDIDPTKMSSEELDKLYGEIKSSLRR